MFDYGSLDINGWSGTYRSLWLQKIKPSNNILTLPEVNCIYSVQSLGLLLQQDVAMPDQKQYVDPQSANIASEEGNAMPDL